MGSSKAAREIEVDMFSKRSVGFRGLAMFCFLVLYFTCGSKIAEINYEWLLGKLGQKEGYVNRNSKLFRRL